ncbi:alpha-L-fucosidase-like isoform X3 [Haliotis rubra]|uniref:alpha-L-fucosidase-like isoform X3 n=1 Tax=Haliotis rubra TaxID=36100 RepID=UPI001EE58AC0|nr:alpha-L-fucosidase-like isoform X3 [Haliotis rubra]
MAGLLLFTLLTVTLAAGARYDPTWESLDQRPLPAWYDEAKFGIFLHWGVFSVPSFAGAWFQEYWRQNRADVVEFMKKNYRPDFTYADFAAQFTAEFYNPDEWAEIFNASGARYVVLTTKHHEGFCNWPTKHSFNWNAMDVGPHRDLVGDLAKSIRKKTTIKFGLYHSLFEFVNPIFLQDKKNGFKTQDFVKYKTMPELYELVNLYKPDIVWSDGDLGASYTYWNSTEFLAWLYNDSPVKDTVVTNDRWGKGTACKHGGFYTCTDRYNPGVAQKHKFEDATTIHKTHWGFIRNAKLSDFHTIEELLTELVTVVSCGGNILLNVGPTPDGMISPIYEERLRQMGQWLNVNGDAIYETRPWTFQNDTATPGVWYTSKKSATGISVYAIALSWPKGGKLELAVPQAGTATTVTLLGYPGHFDFQAGATSGMTITVPAIPADRMPCQWAWVFRLDNLKNQ